MRGAGELLGMECGVKESVRDLCQCLLDAAFQFESDRDTLLSSLQPPRKKAAWDVHKREREIRGLVRLAYDLLILRKWAWYGSWDSCTPLSPLCWCLAYGYGYHTRGREKEGARLNSALTAFSSDCEQYLPHLYPLSCPPPGRGGPAEREAILQFLALLARELSDQTPLTTEQLDASSDSGVFCYDICPSSLFEQLPGSSLTAIQHAIHENTTLFTCPPGSGFRGFLSAEPLTADRTPAASSLFDGLTHSTTASLNSHLHFPTLPSHPHLLNLLPNPFSLSMAPPHPPSPPTSPYTPLSNEDFSLPARGWDGWLHRCGVYLTEAGAEAVEHAQFLSRANLPIEPRPLKPHPSDDEGCHLASSLEVWQEGGSVARAFGAALSRLQQYQQTLADGYLGGTAMEQHIGSQAMEPLTCLLSAARDTAMTGLGLMDTLFTQCCAVQGTPHYPLLLSLLTLTITPYTHFMSQWLFCGWLDEGEEFGIHSNHHALQCRDHRYWADSYTATNQCTPTFLSQHSHTILACGKALNLLHICCPQHPLCGQVTTRPPVAIATTLEQLEQLTQQCQGYWDDVGEMVTEQRLHRQRQAKAMQQEAMQEVLEARRATREAVLAARDREQQLLVQQKRAKAEWCTELETRATEARILKMEQGAKERERDRELVAVLVSRDEALSAHERKLAEDARAELVAHYAALSREAEQRRERAEWREARWRLASRRQQWIEEERGRWEREGGEEGSVEEREITEDQEGVFVALQRSEVSPPSSPSQPSPLPALAEPEAEQTPVTTDPVHFDKKPSPPPPPSNDELWPIRGHAPPTTIQHLIHHGVGGADGISGHTPSGHHDVPPPTHYRHLAPPSNDELRPIRGHAPPTTIQHLIHPGVGGADGISGHTPSGRHEVPPPSTHYHHKPVSRAPPTTIQNLLYPLTSANEATPTTFQSPAVASIPCPPPQSYTLSYPQLDEAPQSDLLTPVIGPIPVQNGTEADMLLPLPSLLDHALSLPLLTQNFLVNSALLDHFLTSCHMTSHFLALKRFLLLEDGEFAHSLATQLFHKLLYGGSYATMRSPAFLNPLLQSALDSSLHGDSPNAQLLTFAVGDSSPLAPPHAVDALDFLQLRYKVEWPCNIVITESALRKYNKVFHLLLQLRRASWTLKNVFTQIQRCEGLEKWQRRELQIHRHELQHFVDVMQGYIANQLFYLSWRELEDDLARRVHSLDNLITAHQNFIDKSIFRCLLSKKATAVMKIIQTIFSSILRFCTTLTSSHPSPQHHYHTMCHTHRKFRETAGLLMKVIMKLVDRGYQPHLEDFLLRLNFNNFYG